MTPKPLPEFLQFGLGNAKLEGIHHFSLPSGHSCPGARACWAKADPETGRLQDHPNQEFRCFSASTEAAFANVRYQRWANFTLLLNAKTREGMRELITISMPRHASIVRVHVGGDFFSQTYFDAWMDAAETFPETRFYAYTKSLNFWAERLLDLPKNFHLTASHGGRYDYLIDRLSLKSARVVFSPEAAAALSLEVDHDDSHAYDGKNDFALLIHGGQPPGTEAAEAKKALETRGVQHTYSKTAVARR